MKLNNVCIKMRFGSSTQNNKYIKMLDPRSKKETLRPKWDSA